MAVWLIANNLWSSTEEPENLGLVNGVQTYRVQSLMNAYNNSVDNDELTLDPDSSNFKDSRGNRLKTVVFEMEGTLAVTKSIKISGGKYRLRLDAEGNDYGVTIGAPVKLYDVDFVRVVRTAAQGVYVNPSGRLDCYRCLLAGIKGGFAVWFNSSRGSFTDCAFISNVSTNSTSAVDVGRSWGTVTYTRCVVSDSVSDASNHVDRINLAGLTQAQIDAIGFVKPPKAGLHLDSDETSPTYNKYIYDDGSEWTMNDWNSVDLHLRPDSPYATGNSLTTADGEVLDLDGVPRKPGGAKGAYEVAKSVVYFDTTGWGGTGALSWLGVTETQWGNFPTYLCSTVDQAVSAAPIEGIVTPDPDSASFRDAAGFRLHTVTVPLRANLTISKSITLAGGAYRLRLDGIGNYKVLFNDVCNVSDVDFVDLLANDVCVTFNGGRLNRVMFAGLKNTSARPAVRNNSASTSLNLFDCAFICNLCKVDYECGSVVNATVNYYRCVGLLYGDAIDCINLRRLTQEQVNAIGFVKPPKVLDLNNPGYYTDGTEWTSEDWKGYNLNLLPTSEYATGATSVTEDEPVYDLAGNKRKVGGARGAYEVLDDVTSYAPTEREIRWVRGEQDDDAPDYYVGFDGLNLINGAPLFRIRGFTGKALVEYMWGGSSFSKWNAGSSAIQVTLPSAATSRTCRISLCDDSENPISGYAYFTIYVNGTAPPSAFLCARFGNSGGWRNTSGGVSSVNSASVYYVCTSCNIESTAATVAKIYIPGWTHVVLGDVEGEIVLGLGATVETSGKLTLKNVTAQSDELMKRIQLRAPAKLTIDSGVITGTTWDNPTGTTIVLKSTTLSGKLPNNFELSDSSLQITENTTVDKITIKGTVSISVSENVFLSVKESFDLLDATVVTLESTGYVAVPYGTDFNLFEAGTNGSTDKLCYYGAGVSTISAVVTVQTAKIEFTKNAPSIPVLVERKKDDLWETVGFDSNICDVSDDEKQIVFRAFDGENFVQALPTRRTFYLKNKDGGSFATAGDWTLDKQRTIVCSNAPQIPDNIFDCRF